MKNLIRFLGISLGFLCLGVGALGIVLPILPTTPFLMLAAILFAKSSRRFHKWFLSTNLYKKHLESMIVKKEMTAKSKTSILITVSILFLIGLLIAPIWHAKLLILVVAAFHYYFILFRVRTTK